jgi:hypothetical protein
MQVLAWLAVTRAGRTQQYGSNKSQLKLAAATYFQKSRSRQVDQDKSNGDLFALLDIFL